MRDLFTDQGIGYDAGYVTTETQNRIGDDAHQPDIATTINQGIIALEERAAELSRRLGVFRTTSQSRTCEDANFPCQTGHWLVCCAIYLLIRLTSTTSR